MRANLSRRDFVLGGACLCCAAALRAAPHSDAPLITTEIAAGVHVRRGVHAPVTSAEGDAIANLGFVIGAECVAVIDPGGSLRDGERLRTRIRELTARPIRYVVMSHVHPDHIFGAGAFLRDEPQFIGHRELPAALAQRGEYYRDRIETALGRGAAGPIVAPTRTIDDEERLDLGERTLRIVAHPIAHTNNDLTVLDELSGTLFASDLLFVERVPSLDGSLKGWLEALTALAALDVKRAVPGHGPAHVELAPAVAKLRTYLEALLTQTRAAIASGIEIDAAPEHVAQTERSKWRLFDEHHGHNVTQAFRELEWE
jgi:quinoprotein relay system zinc metallohydrolase 2